MSVIVQLSDFHLGDDAEAQARLDAVLAHVAAMATPPDALIVSGDVLDVPGRVGDYEQVAALLSPLGLPLVACPGNHDDRAGFRRLLGLEAVDAPFNSRLQVGSLTILACDTSVPGASWGVLAADTVAWLDSELRTAPGQVLVVMHHTPAVVGMPLIDEIRLRQTEELERLLQGASNVLGVVCGHAHTTAATTFAGLPLFVCPAVSMTILLEQEVGGTPFFDRAAPPAFAVHIVEDGRLASHVRVVGAALPGMGGA